MAETKINASQTTITASDIGAAGAVTVLPTASATEEGKIYQFTGTTDATYTNGYFYKCVSDGLNPATYSWTQVNVQPAGSSLPSQTGQSGKFLTTDGTDASWGSALVNSTSNSDSLSINGTINGTGSYNTAIQGTISSSTAEKSVVIGYSALVYSHYSVAIGANSYADYMGTAIGYYSYAYHSCAVALGTYAKSTAVNAIQIGCGDREYATNSDADTMKVANRNGNFEMMSSDGTIPLARTPNMLPSFTSMPSGGIPNGKIAQFIGTTDANYTNGYFYKATAITSTATGTQTTGSGLTDIAVNVSLFESQNGTTTGNYAFTYRAWASLWASPDNYLVNLAEWGISYTGTPSDNDVITIAYTAESTTWARVDVQPGGSSLPSQTGNAGKFLTTDGTDASWGNALANNATGSFSIATGNSSVATGVHSVAIGSEATTGASSTSVAIGYQTQTSATGVAIGSGSRVSNSSGIAIGINCRTTANAAIQLGCDGFGGTKTNSDANTFKVANANGNFELMSADGTIPKERLTKVVTTPSTMPTLAVADWSSNTQTVNVTGVTATNTVFVSPAPASAADYASAGIVCTSQGSGTLTFTCTTTPTSAITVNVVILG